MLNWLRRLKVYVVEDGHIYHFGDGKDFKLVKELEKRWVSKDAFTYDHKDELFGQYLRSIGFDNVRVICGSVFRYKGETSSVNMVLTNKMSSGK